MTFKSRRGWLTLALVAAGCAGANPFIAARFAGGLSGKGGGGGTTTQTTNNIQDTCDLSSTLKVFNGFALANAAKQNVNYSVTFIASAGTGGWVCDDDLDDYLNAGYRAIPLDSRTNTATIGCDPVPLSRGSQLLALRISGQIQADASGGNNPQLAASPLNGNVRIPIPELIVVGDNANNFLCQGSNACTQGGFVYTDQVGTSIAKATANRTQGTICQSRVGNLPEWRLFDPNFPDTQAAAFDYVAGAIVSVVVLDRANNSDPNVNQVVWQVRSAGGTIIHDFQP